jgi:hypothetical protein
MSALRRKPEEALDEDAEWAIEDLADDPEVTLEKKDRSAIIRKCLMGLSHVAQKLRWRTIPGTQKASICPCPVWYRQARSSRPAGAPNSRRRKNAERCPVSTPHEQRAECPPAVFK